MNDNLRLIGNWLLNNPLLLGLLLYIVILLVVAISLIFITIRLHRANQKKAQQWASMEARWQPLMMKVLSGDDWPEHIQSAIGPGEGLFFIDFLMRYAEKLQGNSKNMVAELAAPYMPRLLNNLRTGDAEQRARAIITLAALTPDQHQREIVEALNDNSPLVSMLAARSLAENHSIDHLQPILNKMERFRSWSPSFLISMLVSLAKEQPEILREALLDPHQADWVKTVLMKALTELNDWQALPLAAQCLELDVNRELQAAALQFVAKIGHEGLVEMVRKKCDHPDFVVRLHAVKALASLGSEIDRGLLLHLLRKDDSQWIAYQAAQALKATGSQEVLYAVSVSEHPRAELAREVLYDLESWETILFLVQHAPFADYVPQWMRSIKRRDIRDNWRQVQNVLLSDQSHLEVRMAIAKALDPQVPDWLFEAVLQDLLNQRQTPPLHLILAIYQMRPAQASAYFKQWFYEIEDPDIQFQVILKLLESPGREHLSFYKELQSRLEGSREGLKNLSDNLLKQIQAKTQRAIHEGLLASG